MNIVRLVAIGCAIVCALIVGDVLSQDVVYFDNGESYTLLPGERIYITEDDLWVITGGQFGGRLVILRAEPVTPPSIVEEELIQLCDELGFGPGACFIEDDNDLTFGF